MSEEIVTRKWIRWFWNFRFWRTIVFLNLNGQNIYATHGHVWNPGKLPMLKAGDILLNGHTHIPACEKIHTEADQSVMYMNPGSVSIPKENSEHSYMICENGVFEWKNLEGEGYQIWKRDTRC